MRLIDADALGVVRCGKDILPAAYCAGWNGLVNLIEQAPTIDAVHVVRCKDCNKRDTSWCPMYYARLRMEDNDFCSYGERKDGEG